MMYFRCLSLNPRLTFLGRLWLSVMLGSAAFGLLVLGLSWISPAQSFAIAAASISSTPKPLTLTLLVNTGAPEQEVAVNGTHITYTLRISRNQAISGLVITNTLPFGLLPGDVTLPPNCGGSVQPITRTAEFPDVRGGKRQVIQLQGISWQPSAPCDNEISFSVDLYGRPDGSEIENSAVAVAAQNGEADVLDSAVRRTRIRVVVSANGTASTSRVPTWLSNDAGGTYSQDWGDYDNDGFLDLALGSAAGLSVYRNNRSQLQWQWSDPNQRPAQGVRWADVTGDGKLELVSVGVSGTTGGFNFIYTVAYDEASKSTQVTQGEAFLKDMPLVRIVAADFNRDGMADLVASSSSLNPIQIPVGPTPKCQVQFLRRQDPTSFVDSVDLKLDNKCFASASMTTGDVNNDGYPDLIVGVFPNRLLRFIYSNTNSLFVDPTAIDNSQAFPPYDLALGDYDNDGFLDLAAAYPLQREVRIYRNKGVAEEVAKAGTFDNRYYVLPTTQFLTPLALDWADFTGDGRLDLLVASAPPVIYQVTGTATTLRFVPAPVPFALLGSDQRWSARAVRLRTNGDPDVLLSNRAGPSTLVNTFVPHLQPSLAFTQPFAAASIALGNVNGSGGQDLLLGVNAAGAMHLLANSDANTLTLASTQIPGAGLGPHQVALGDTNLDGKLEVLVGTLSNARLFAYPLNANSLPLWQSVAPVGKNHRVAFGDLNGDGMLDAVVGSQGRQGGLAVYLNVGGNLAAAPVWVASTPLSVTSIALGDVDNDTFLDIGLGLAGQPSVILRNNTNNTFSPMWSSPSPVPTASIALADVNNDGLPDLTLGGQGTGFAIYENVQGRMKPTPSFSSTAPDNPINQTSSLAWADWDHDGDVDLAVGNIRQPMQVFANIGSKPGALALSWVWQSQEAQAVTGLSWGDINGDGDLDLAVSQSDVSGVSGVYLNTTSGMPRNLNQLNPHRLVQQAPLVITVNRPDGSDDAYGYSSSRLVGLDRQPVTITFAITNANVLKTESATPIVAVKAITYAFSVDGGSNWRVATPHTLAQSLVFPIILTRYVTHLKFVWDADGVVSNQALFRVRVVASSSAGPVAQAATRGVSPPFQARALQCTWPANPHFIATWSGPTPPKPGTLISFRGGITTTERDGSKVTNHIYLFDFGDGTVPIEAQYIPRKTFAIGSTYQVRVTVRSARSSACPVTREVSNVFSFVVGNGLPLKRIYLPQVVLQSAPTLHGAQTTEATPLQHLPQIDTLNSTQDGNALALTWSPPETTRPISGYHVYRSWSNGKLEQIAALPANITTTHVSAICNSSVWVTVFDSSDESLPSTASSYLGCP